MPTTEITAAGIDKIAQKCIVGGVVVIDSTLCHPQKVSCKAIPALESQREYAHCPEPHCPLAAGKTLPLAPGVVEGRGIHTRTPLYPRLSDKSAI
jgi:hypothetical protein